MHRIHQAAAALVVTALTLTFAPSSAQAEVGSTRGWIEGRVLDGNGDPLPDVLVNSLDADTVPEGGLADDLEDRRALTDEDGRFRVRQAPVGSLIQICTPEPGVLTSCKETARGVDFVNTYVGGSGVTDSWVTQRSLLHTSSVDRDLGDVTVKPESRIHGLLSGAEAGHPVRVMRLNDSVAFTTWTDDSGAYDFDGLAPGSYYVAAGGNDFLPWRSDDLTLAPEEDQAVNGVLDHGAELTGLVTEDGDPVTGLDVLIRRNGKNFAATTTDGDGRYTVTGLSAGNYSVETFPTGRYLVDRSSRTVPSASGSFDLDLGVETGARIVLRAIGEKAPQLVRDELRDSAGRAIQPFLNDGTGKIVYSGLEPGKYRVAIGGAQGYAIKSVTITTLKTYNLGQVRATTPYLTLRGRTEPGVVVEATTGDFCPVEDEPRYGGFHEIEVADDDGDYVIRKLVPGLYMVAVATWPQDFVPRCTAGVRLLASKKIDLPLAEGARAKGRLVYADTGTPVITTLSYEFRFAPGNVNNPTNEHPARDRTEGATGSFTVTGMRAGSATGFLAEQPGEDITDAAFAVVFPYQDGTPYWLETEDRPVTFRTDRTQHLGDVKVIQH